MQTAGQVGEQLREVVPYISLPSAAKFGKCSRSGPHILVRQKELKAFLASAAMSTHSG